MNVRELIEELLQHDPDTEVKVVYQSGDYWRTELAKDICSVSVGVVSHSSYHNCDAVVDECDEDRDGGDDDQTREAILIG